MRTFFSMSVFSMMACGSSQPVPVQEPTEAVPAEPTTAETATPAEPATPPEPPAPAEPPPPPAPPEAHVAGPDVYKVLAENETARVYEIKMAKGAKVPMHQHPDH